MMHLVHHEINNPRHIDEHRQEITSEAQRNFEENFDIPNFSDYFNDNTNLASVSEVEIIDPDDQEGDNMINVKICDIRGGKRPIYSAKQLGCIFGMKLNNYRTENNDIIYCCDHEDVPSPEIEGVLGRAMHTAYSYFKENPGQSLIAATIGPIVGDIVMEGVMAGGKALGKSVISLTGAFATKISEKIAEDLTVSSFGIGKSKAVMNAFAKKTSSALIEKIGPVVQKFSQKATGRISESSAGKIAERLAGKFTMTRAFVALDFIMQAVLFLQIVNEVMNNMDTGGYGQYIENVTIREKYRDQIESNYINESKNYGLNPPFILTLDTLNICENEGLLDVYSVYMDAIQSYHTQLLRNMKQFFDKSLEDKIIIQNALLRGIPLQENYLINIAPDINEKFEERDEFIWNYMQNHLQESSKEYVVRVPEVSMRTIISITLSKSGINIYNADIEKLMKQVPDNPYPFPKAKWTRFYRDINEQGVIIQKSLPKEFAFIHQTGDQLIEHMCTEGMDPDELNKKFPLRGRTCCAEWCKGDIVKPKDYGAGYDVDTGLCYYSTKYCEHSGYNASEEKHFQCEGLGCDKNSFINCKLSDGQEFWDATPLPTSIVKNFAENPWTAVAEGVGLGVLAVGFALGTLATGGALAGVATGIGAEAGVGTAFGSLIFADAAAGAATAATATAEAAALAAGATAAEATAAGAAATAGGAAFTTLTTVGTAGASAAYVGAAAGATYLAEGCPFTDTALGDALDIRDDGLYSREGEQDNKDSHGLTCGTEGAEC